MKDADAARAGIAKLDAGSDTKTGVAIRGDYAIVSATQAEADKYATGPTLAESANFTSDMEALGEPGVLSFWGDLGKLVQLGGAQVAADPTLTEQIKNGRFAGALRFDGSYAELAAITRGVTSPVALTGTPVKLGELPDTTAGALAISGLGEGVKSGWDQIVKSAESAGGGAQFTQFITQAQQQFGLVLPDDLATLLGESVTVAIDSQGLDGNMPNAGAVLATDPVKAGEVLTKVEQALAVAGQPLQLAKAPRRRQARRGHQPGLREQARRGGHAEGQRDLPDRRPERRFGQLRPLRRPRQDREPLPAGHEGGGQGEPPGAPRGRHERRLSGERGELLLRVLFN